MDDRRKNLEAFVQQLKGGDPLSEDFLPEIKQSTTQKYPHRIAELRALKARDLSENALANEVLKNTGIPIPDMKNRDKAEDFLNRIMKERYPELEPEVFIGEAHRMPNELGYFQPENKLQKQHIKINPLLLDNKNPEKAVATLLHEAGHQYDDNILKYQTLPDGDLNPKRLFSDNTTSNRLITEVDPTQAYEIMAKGHHAEIPKLREGSFGLGALKSYLKSGKFKQLAGAVPYVGTALAGAAALSTPDASAAVGDALVPGGLESLGPSQEDADIENPQANPELRKQALMRLKNGR